MECFNTAKRKTSSLPKGFEATMKQRWGTLVYLYRINHESELISKINEIEDSFLSHRQDEYSKMGESTPDEIDLRKNMEFGNMKIIIDDLHKELVKSDPLARKFQAIRHSGIELLFVTQSFKNTNMHDLIKENLSYVILFKLSQNKVTVKSYLSDLSMLSTSARAKQEYRSTLEYIYSRLVQRNDSIFNFPRGRDLLLVHLYAQEKLQESMRRSNCRIQSESTDLFSRD